MGIEPFSIAYLLGAIVVLLLGAKLVATAVLLTKRRESWFSNRTSEVLWWVTKIAPVVAAPCFLGFGLYQHNDGYVIAAIAMMAFVAVAVPIKIRRAYGRKRNQPGRRVQG